MTLKGELMKRMLVVLLALVGSVCGGNDDGSAGVATSTSSTPSVGTAAPFGGKPIDQLSEHELVGALLTIAELPLGFVVDTPPQSSAGQSGLDSVCGKAPGRGTVRDASVIFKKSAAGPGILERIIAFEPGRAAEALEEHRRASQSCRAFDNKNAITGADEALEISAFTLPNVDGDVLAYRLAASGGGAAGGAERVYVRRGDVIVKIVNTAVGVAPDSNLTQELTRKALARLR